MPAYAGTLIQTVGNGQHPFKWKSYMPLDVAAQFLGLYNIDVLKHIRNDRTQKDIYCSVACTSKKRENNTNLHPKERH